VAPASAQASVSRALLARAEAAYLGLALGDALGATVEFMTPREIVHHFGVHREIVGGGWLKLRPGQVTDDTGMSLALGEAILANGGSVVPLACAKGLRCLDAAQAGRYRQYRPPQPGDLPPDRRAGRAVVGSRRRQWCRDARAAGGPGDPRPIASRRARSRAGAGARHAQQRHLGRRLRVPDAGGAGLSARLFAAGGGQPAHPASLLAEHPELSFRDRPRRENPSGWVVETLQAVLQGLDDSAGFEDCLVDVVNRGGDADTTGAIAGMLAARCTGRRPFRNAGSTPSIPASPAAAGSRRAALA
jgi:ADP-ribosyl-[dinitrogen reductase] hydrolase